MRSIWINQLRRGSTTKRISGLLVAITCLGLFPPTATSQQLSPEKATALAAVEALKGDILDMSMALWDYAELALLETRSAEYLADFLEGRGFHRGAGSGRDAHRLRGLLRERAAHHRRPGRVRRPSRDRERRRAPERSPGKTAISDGQGCGHNLFGAGSVGAAVAIKRTMEAHGLSGTVRLYGTPAEETVVGKVYMAKAGLFDDLDAVLDWHPSLETKVSNQSGQAMNNFEVEFFGQAAHCGRGSVERPVGPGRRGDDGLRGQHDAGARPAHDPDPLRHSQRR